MKKVNSADKSDYLGKIDVGTQVNSLVYTNHSETNNTKSSPFNDLVNHIATQSL